MRRFFLILLGLLQLVAPLVHAHSKQAIPQFGLHLPNLEVYSAVLHAPIVQNTDFLQHADSASVSISTGIQSTVDTDDSLNSDYFPVEPFVFKICLAKAVLNFSPPLEIKRKKLTFLLSAPRAPPHAMRIF